MGKHRYNGSLGARAALEFCDADLIVAVEIHGALGPVRLQVESCPSTSSLVRCFGLRATMLGWSLRELRFVCVLIIVTCPFFFANLLLVWVPSAESFHRPKPTDMPRDPGYCKDVNDNCAMWAARGECESNAKFMVSTSILCFFLLSFHFCFDFVIKKRKKQGVDPHVVFITRSALVR